MSSTTQPHPSAPTSRPTGPPHRPEPRPAPHPPGAAAPLPAFSGLLEALLAAPPWDGADGATAGHQLDRAVRHGAAGDPARFCDAVFRQLAGFAAAVVVRLEYGARRALAEASSGGSCSGRIEGPTYLVAHANGPRR